MKRPGNWTENFLRDEKGGVLILVAVLIAALMGTAALAVDAGNLYKVRRDMVNTADSAALWGAQELFYDSNWANVENKTETFTLGHYEPDFVTVEPVGNNGVKVTAVKNVNYAFARFLGLTDSDVAATATAVFAAQAEGNIIPLGMSKSFLDSLPLGEDSEFVYFEDNHFGPGNWSWIYFTKTENKFKTHEYLEDGYDAKLGDPVWTNTGANILASTQDQATVSAILDNYIENVTTLYIPIIEYNASGETAEKWVGKTPAIITGFAAVVLTGYDFDGATSAFTISGYLVRMLDAGEIDDIGSGNRLIFSGVGLVD